MRKTPVASIGSKSGPVPASIPPSTDAFDCKTVAQIANSLSTLCDMAQNNENAAAGALQFLSGEEPDEALPVAGSPLEAGVIHRCSVYLNFLHQKLANTYMVLNGINSALDG